MILNLSSLKDNDLNHFCNLVLEKNFFASKIDRMLKRNPDLLLDQFNCQITETNLVKLIDNSLKRKSLRNILISIVDLIDGNCVSDDVFFKLVNYPLQETRDLIIVCLCHKKLSASQLIVLCDIGTQFECFFELACLYYTNDEYSINTLKDYFETFKKSKFSYMYSDLLLELNSIKLMTNNEKKKLVSELLNK